MALRILITLALAGSFVGFSLAEERSFPVEPLKFYTLEVMTDRPAEVEIRFFDAAGADIARQERELGYSESAIRTLLEPRKENRIVCRAGANVGLTPTRARVRVIDSRGDVAASRLRWFQGDCTRNDGESSGIDSSFVGRGESAANLIANGSFEELDGNGLPRGWHWDGPGQGRISKSSYSGNVAISLPPESAPGRWVSETVPLVGTNPVAVVYAVRFSPHAAPHGHLDPVRVEFLRSDGSVIAHPRPIPRQEFSFQRYGRFYGEWFPALAHDYDVPEGAVALRTFCEHRERRVDGRGGDAGWGEILVDDVSVWQAARCSVPADLDGFVYAGLVCSTVKRPRHPVGCKRPNSVAIVQTRRKDASVFFEGRGEKPSVELAVADLLGYRRRILLRGRVKDEDGKEISIFTCPVDVPPCSVRRQRVAVHRPPSFGAYELECEALEGSQVVAKGRGRFACMPDSAPVPQAERSSGNYHFDLHPGPQFCMSWTMDPDTAELECALAEMLGAGAFRLQTRYESFNPASDPETMAEAARGVVRRFRGEKLPALKRHGLGWWPSLMEQEGQMPRTEQEFASWGAWHRAFASELKGEADFVLWGNEGLGGYVSHMDVDEPLTGKSGFQGSTRDWWTCCHAALRALKAGDSGVLCGPAHASDPDGLVARRFVKLKEGNFPFDCWGANAYVNPARIMSSIARELGNEHVSRSFGVIPEVGHQANSTGEFKVAADLIPKTYMSVLADTPWVKRIAWFILGDFYDYSMFDDRYAPRPAVCAYMTMTRMLGAGRVVKQSKLADGGRVVLWQRDDGRRVAVGWSPTRMKFAFSSTGRKHLVRTGIYGLVSDEATDAGQTVVSLDARPAYFSADGLDFLTTLRAAARVAKNGRELELAIRNERRNLAQVEISADAHAFVHLACETQKLCLAAGERRILRFPFRACRASDERMLPVRFDILEANGISHAVTVDVSNAAGEDTPKNLLGNADLSEWTADGPAGWSVRTVPGPGGKTAPDWSVRQGGDSPTAGKSCATISVPGAHPHVYGRIEVVQNVGLKPHTRYYFSSAMKLVAQGNWPYPIAIIPGVGCFYANVVRSRGGIEPAESEWRRFECVFETGPESVSGEFALRMQNIGYGEARFADVELFEIK